MLFSLCFFYCFVYLFYLTLIRCIALLSFTTSETSSLKILFVLATGLAQQLTHMVFRSILCDSNMLEHNHQFAKLWVSAVVFFFVFIDMKLISAVWYCCFSFAAFVLLRDLSQKNALINHYHCHLKIKRHLLLSNILDMSTRW